MRKFPLIGILVGAGLIMLGIFARNPGQIAISTAVIATGALVILFTCVLTAILFFKKPDAGSSDQ